MWWDAVGRAVVWFAATLAVTAMLAIVAIYWEGAYPTLTAAAVAYCLAQLIFREAPR